MIDTPVTIKRTYYVLLLGNTLAASLIWGINTIFLLDAGLSNFEAFAANAFFTAGMVLFEVPTGIVADMWGRRASFLFGTITLAAATALYVTLWRVEAPFWQWAIVSVLLGLGFTFFSGATEAWLVDALQATGYEGSLEAVFGRAQVITGAATLGGSAGGGFLAQATNLGVPFVVRAVVLLLMFVVALVLMRDIGFTPNRQGRPLTEIRRIASNSVEYGWRVPAIRNIMLAGDREAYGIAGVAAGILATAQIAGGLLAPRLRRLVPRRTSALLLGSAVAAAAVLLMGLITNFYAVLALTVMWGVIFAAVMPIRQAYINGLIPSPQRATILSFDSLTVLAQPALGRAADVWGYPASYVLSGVLTGLALPFIARARAQNAPADHEVEVQPTAPA